MKVAVIGANGQLGYDVCAAFSKEGHEIFPLNHTDIQVEYMDSVSRALWNSKCNVIVNTSALHNVEQCETMPDRCFQVNAQGVANLAEVANYLGAVLIQASTDMVFGDSQTINPLLPREETDQTNPLNVYGATKLKGEEFATQAKRHFILRLAGVYGKQPCRAKGGLNFIGTMRKLAQNTNKVRVVDDEYTSPTPTTDIAQQMVILSKTDAYGLYHASSESWCSWYEFAGVIFKHDGIPLANLQIAEPGEFPNKVRRPNWCVMENAALKDAGLNVFRHWKTALKEYLGD